MMLLDFLTFFPQGEPGSNLSLAWDIYTFLSITCITSSIGVPQPSRPPNESSHIRDRLDDNLVSRDRRL